MGESSDKKIQWRRPHRIRMARGAHTRRVNSIIIVIVTQNSHYYIGSITVIHFFRDGYGKEVISRFKIPFYPNDKTFYTDSNGREMLKRVLNYRPSFNLRENAENVSGNYYPVTSRISLTDNNTRFSILNDRSQGGSSLDNGEIELMVF